MAKPSTFINMVATLFVISFVSSVALGVAYELTKEPIAKAALAKKISAITEVLPAFDNDPLAEASQIATGDGRSTFYPARKKGKVVGFAVETFSMKGFSGQIRLMVGLLPDGTINKITVIQANETPGLGDKISEKKSDFAEQFFGRNPATFDLRVKKDGGDVDAITAATISSRAFCDAVMRAYQAYQKGTKQ